MRTRPTTEEPRGWVALAAFVTVCAFADLSPLLKLRPPSVALDALIGGVAGHAWAVFALFAAAAIGLPAVLAWWLARRLPLPEGRAARFVYAALVGTMGAVAGVVGSRAAALQAVGRGSDQEACIVLPARALMAGHWPYDRTLIWSGNPCSPGIGWILLATPFVLVAWYGGFLLAGAVGFFFVPARLMDAGTKMRMLLLTLSCATAWQSLATGADTLAIGFALALVTTLVEERRFTIALAVVTGLVASARLPLAFFPFLLGAEIAAGGGEDKARARVFATVAVGTLLLAHGVPILLDARSYVHDGPAHLFRISAGLLRGEGVSGAIFVGCGVAWIASALGPLRRAFRGAGPTGACERHFDVGTLTLLSVLAPAAVDLLFRLRASPPGFEEDPATWRGGNWLLLALPSYAAAAAIAFSRGATSPYSRSPDRS